MLHLLTQDCKTLLTQDTSGDPSLIFAAEMIFNKSLLDQTAHCAWTNADEAVADAYTTTPSLLSTGAKKLFDS